MVHPRVLRAMSTPLLGHLDPKFLEIMNEVQAQLRAVFRTENPFTIAVSGTGSAGMEAALVNLIEPGDAVIVVVAGVFGARMADIVGRAGGRLVKLEVPWGETIERGPDRGGAEEGGQGEGGGPRPRRDLHRRAAADRGARQALPRARRAARRRHRDVARRRAGRGRRLGGRRRLLRHAEVPLLPARARAAHAVARARSRR